MRGIGCYAWAWSTQTTRKESAMQVHSCGKCQSLFYLKAEECTATMEIIQQRKLQIVAISGRPEPMILDHSRTEGCPTSVALTGQDAHCLNHCYHVLSIRLCYKAEVVISCHPIVVHWLLLVSGEFHFKSRSNSLVVYYFLEGHNVCPGQLWWCHRGSPVDPSVEHGHDAHD